MNMDQRILVGAFPTCDALHRTPGAVINRQGQARTSPVSDAPHRRPGVVKSRQGFPHFHGRVRVKKLVQENKLRLGSWNIGTLTGRGMELVDTMIRRRVNIVCLQETKWVGEKAKEIGTGFKLWYSGKVGNKNGVGIVVDKTLKDEVVEVRRVGDRLIRLKLVLGEVTLNVVSAYAPQVGLDDAIKR